MKVLHLVAIPQLTGAAEPTIDMVYALRALGAQVDLRIDTRREGNLRGLLLSRGDWIGEDLVLSTKGGITDALLDLGRLRELVYDYDVIHTHLSHDHALAALALDRRPRPRLIRTIHAERGLRPGRLRGWLYERADAVTVASRDDARRLLDAFPELLERIAVVPGAVDADHYRPRPEARARLRAALGLGEEDVAIACVARFQAGRRHGLMLEAFARARTVAPMLRLVLIGHGELEAEIRARAAQPDVADGVIFPGYRRFDLPEYLSAMDAALWLVPGNDATSRAVLQALATGLPVIGGRVGAIAEVLNPGVNGFLVSPDEPTGVAQAMVRLAQSGDERRAMGARGRAQVQSRHSQQHRAALLLQLYQTALARP